MRGEGEREETVKGERSEGDREKRGRYRVRRDGGRK
jgi:hypothetical protein